MTQGCRQQGGSEERERKRGGGSSEYELAMALLQLGFICMWLVVLPAGKN